MAKVSSTGLPWLSKPSAGFELFARPIETSVAYSQDGVSPNRLVATRDTEVFVGRGKEIRCANLQDIKARHPKFKAAVNEKSLERQFKVLDLPEVDFEIKQLEISNDRLFLAIVGEREVAVCVLPGEGFLKRGENRVTVPHFHQVGPGLHSSAAGAQIVRVLWHPFGVEGASLVVLTADGYVRSYDFRIGSDISFEVPDETYDFFTLGGQKRHVGGFAADQEDMEPASCCFGSGEEGWRPFTLYIVMRGGDVYALSPIVPSRWMASREYLQNLSLSITAELESLDENASWEQRGTIRQRTKWINDVLNQEANLANARSISSGWGDVTSMTRPNVVGPNPLLQGPFLFQPEPPEAATGGYYAACDIFHVDTETVGVIGIAYSDGRVEIFLEFDPVGARWVDKKKPPKPGNSEDHGDLPVISNYETVNLGLQTGPDSGFTNWPVFAREPQSNKTWFVNHSSGVTSFSIKEWLERLDVSLYEDEDSDITNLLEMFKPSEVQPIIHTDNQPIVGCTVVYEAYTGYVLVATSASRVFSAEFEVPVTPTVPDEEDTITLQPNVSREPTVQVRSSIPAVTPRAVVLSPLATVSEPVSSSPLYPPYVEAPEFSRPGALPEFLRQEKRRNPKLVTGGFIFSSESSEVLRKARDILKAEFDQLMEAAQEMYDRAAEQRVEYEKQLETLRSVSQKLGVLRSKKVRDRLEKFIERQEELQSKADELLRILVIKNETGLSDAEKKWFREVGRMHERLYGDNRAAFVSRLEELKHMARMLCPDESETAMESSKPSLGDGIPEEVRQGKLKQLRQLLEREDALISSTKKRLERLNIEADRPQGII